MHSVYRHAVEAKSRLVRAELPVVVRPERRRGQGNPVNSQPLAYAAVALAAKQGVRVHVALLREPPFVALELGRDAVCQARAHVRRRRERRRESGVGTVAQRHGATRYSVRPGGRVAQLSTQRYAVVIPSGCASHLAHESTLRAMSSQERIVDTISRTAGGISHVYAFSSSRWKIAALVYTMLYSSLCPGTLPALHPGPVHPPRGTE